MLATVFITDVADSVQILRGALTTISKTGEIIVENEENWLLWK